MHIEPSQMSLGDYCRLHPCFSTQCGYASVLSTHSHAFPETRVDTLVVQHAEPDTFLTAQTVSFQPLSIVCIATLSDFLFNTFSSTLCQQAPLAYPELLWPDAFTTAAGDATCNRISLQAEASAANLLLYLASHCCNVVDKTGCLDAPAQHASSSEAPGPETTRSV